MIDGKPETEDEIPSAAQSPSPPDFSNVRGFQVLRSAEDPSPDDEGWSNALRLELETRATRFHQSVDASIVLASDGIVRWLGDPVARLARGPNILTPRAIILADEALPEASQEIVKTRIELWLAATAQRLLGPLFALEALQEESAPVRDVASRLVRALGILDREPIRGRIKALDQTERAALRKHGVRFGAYYIFVPILIKPAPRSLAVRLWALQTQDDADTLAQTLAPLATSGRTSMPFDNAISAEGYRIAGYRPCGERIVRVDVLERLAGLIRAAFLERVGNAEASEAHHRASNGFVASEQMTSLTGCSGEHFASILRSLGFESVEVRKSEFFASRPAAEPLKESESPPAAEASESAPQNAVEALATDEPTFVDLMFPPEASPQGAPTLEATPPETLPQETAPQETSPQEASLQETTPADSAGPDGVEIAETNASAETAALDAPNSSMETAGPAPEAKSSEVEASADLIVVWRPARKARSQHERPRKDHRARSVTAAGGPATGEAPGRPGAYGRRPDRDGRDDRSRHPGRPASPDAAGAVRRAPSPPTGDAGRFVQPDKNRRQKAASHDMPRVHSAPGRQERTEPDPDSPFAKLLALRSILEGQGDKRS